MTDRPLTDTLILAKLEAINDRTEAILRHVQPYIMPPGHIVRSPTSPVQGARLDDTGRLEERLNDIELRIVALYGRTAQLKEQVDRLAEVDARVTQVADALAMTQRDLAATDERLDAMEAAWQDHVRPLGPEPNPVRVKEARNPSGRSPPDFDDNTPF